MNIKLTTLKYTTLFLASLIFIFASALFFPIVFAVASRTSGQIAISEKRCHGERYNQIRKNVSFNCVVKARAASTATICLTDNTK